MENQTKRQILNSGTEHSILNSETERQINKVVTMYNLIRDCDSDRGMPVVGETVFKTQLIGLLVQIREAKRHLAKKLEELNTAPWIHALSPDEYTVLQRKLTDTISAFRDSQIVPIPDPCRPPQTAKAPKPTPEGSPKWGASASFGPTPNAEAPTDWDETSYAPKPTREGSPKWGASASLGPTPNAEATTDWDETSNAPERLVQEALQAVSRVSVEACRDLVSEEANELRRAMDDLVRRLKKPYTDEQYATLANEVETVDFPLVKRHYETGSQAYTSWCNSCNSPSTAWDSLFRIELQSLLDSGFIIVDERQLPANYKADRNLLAFYLGEEEVTDEALKKFHILLTLTGHQGAHLTFTHDAALGKYIWNNRLSLMPLRPTHDPAAFRALAAFFRFKEICQSVQCNFSEALDRAWEEHEATRRQPAKPKDAVQRGPKTQTLFADKLTASRMSDQLVSYLKEHKLWSNKLSTTKDDTLNAVIVSFLRCWTDEGLLPAKPSAPAIYRFLTQECGLRSDVSPQVLRQRSAAPASGQGLRQGHLPPDQVPAETAPLMLRSPLLRPPNLRPTVLRPTVLRPTVLRPTVLRPTVLRPTD